MIPVEQFTFAIDIKDEYAYLDLGYVISVGDKEKVGIVLYLLDCGANPGGFKDYPAANLKDCIWYFCPDCMALLLKRGADPKAVDDDQYNGSTEVKFRSVLSLLNYYLEKKEHTDILLRMKASLEAYNARDFVIYNEKKKDE